MRRDRRGQLCACEYRRIKHMQLLVSMEWMTVNGNWWWIFAHPSLLLQNCLQGTRRASRNIVGSAFHSSGPLLKSDEGKFFLNSVFVCLFCFNCFCYPRLSSQNRYFTITDFNYLFRLHYLLKSKVKNILKQPRKKLSCFWNLISCSERFSCRDLCTGWLKSFQCKVITVSIKHVVFFVFSCRVFRWEILQSPNCWTILSRTQCNTVLLGYFYMPLILSEKSHWTLQLCYHT